MPQPVDESTGSTSLSCANTIDLFPAYLAEDLSAGQQHDLVGHLRRCEECHDKLLALELYICLVARSQPC